MHPVLEGQRPPRPALTGISGKPPRTTRPCHGSPSKSPFMWGDSIVSPAAPKWYQNRLTSPSGIWALEPSLTDIRSDYSATESTDHRARTWASETSCDSCPDAHTPHRLAPPPAARPLTIHTTCRLSPSAGASPPRPSAEDAWRCAGSRPMAPSPWPICTPSATSRRATRTAARPDLPAVAGRGTTTAPDDRSSYDNRGGTAARPSGQR
jgi:hypothetical protein